MVELRKHPRYPANAVAKIKSIVESECALKDISIAGCRVECADNPQIMLNEQYNLEIRPESGSQAESFELVAQVKWIKKTGRSYEVGFFIIELANEDTFHNYVEYLSC